MASLGHNGFNQHIVTFVGPYLIWNYWMSPSYSATLLTWCLISKLGAANFVKFFNGLFCSSHLIVRESFIWGFSLLLKFFATQFLYKILFLSLYTSVSPGRSLKCFILHFTTDLRLSDKYSQIMICHGCFSDSLGGFAYFWSRECFFICTVVHIGNTFQFEIRYDPWGLVVDNV